MKKNIFLALSLNIVIVITFLLYPSGIWTWIVCIISEKPTEDPNYGIADYAIGPTASYTLCASCQARPCREDQYQCVSNLSTPGDIPDLKDGGGGGMREDEESGLDPSYNIHTNQNNGFDLLCGIWYWIDKGPPTDILSCPTSLKEILRNDNFIPDYITGELLQFYHPGAEYSFRQKFPAPSKAGHQCVYKNDRLLIGPPGGGTVDRYSPSSLPTILLHQVYDVIPWILCCKLSTSSSSSCRQYYHKRPSVV